MNYSSIERGGGCQHKFKFVLLDYTHNNAASTPRLQYKVMGIILKPGERLTKEKWCNKFGME